MLVGLLFSIVLQGVVEAFIPNQCASNITKTPSICCPNSEINGDICGGPERGSCAYIRPRSQFIPRAFQIDDRVAWPTIFFNAVCNCEGNFYGPACDECWFGWTGPNCNIRKDLVRKDIRDLNSTERTIFIQTLARTSTWPSGYSVPVESDNFHSDPLRRPRLESVSVQYLIAYVHHYGSRRTLFKTDEDCRNFGSLDFIHDGPVFLTWHRYFILIWERMLQTIAMRLYKYDGLAVPYWDWTGMRSCDICTNELIGATGDRDRFGLRLHRDSPFYDWDVFCYQPDRQRQCYGCQASGQVGKLTRRFRSVDFPTQLDVDFMMNLPKFFEYGQRRNGQCLSFSMAAEGYCGSPETAGENLWNHNKAHNLIDGTMCCANTAANDPLFLLYHVQVDRLFSVSPPISFG